MEDQQLLQRSADGDAEAFGVLYHRHERAVRRVALATCRSTTVADDVTQDAFLALWRAAARFDPQQGSVLGWVCGMARNRAIDALRRQSVVDRAASAARDERRRNEPSAHEVFATGQDERDLHAAVRRLPDRQRDAVELAFLGELSHTEIGERLDLPLGTVKGRIRLGMARLRADEELLAA